MNPESTPHTPRHLWVVGIVGLLWDAMGAFDYVMTQTRNPEYLAKFTPEQLEFFQGFPAWVVALWALAVWGGLAGTILLLSRRRLAAPVLAGSFVCMVITTIQNFATGAADVMGAAGVAMSAVVFVVALGLALYARRMAVAGVLR